MARHFETVKEELLANPRHWVVSGCAGFIGSHLAETLLRLGQRVTGIDNFATGKIENIKFIQKSSPGNAAFSFVEIDIRDGRAVREFLTRSGAHGVFHQAALGSVPRSIDDPITTHAVNVEGFVNILEGLRAAQIPRLVYASSSSVYGDLNESPKCEERIGRALSPYAVSKRCNELYGDVYAKVYGITALGLRYFNVFGPRQDPEGAYAAVVPRWLAAMFKAEPCTINGDGTITRDFCYVENVVQANILAATVASDQVREQTIFNIGCGETTNLVDLHEKMRVLVTEKTKRTVPERTHGMARVGDVLHSLADISLAKKILKYEPEFHVAEGLAKTVTAF